MERFLPAYTEKYIKEEMDVDELIEKWIMVRNQEFIDKQEETINSILMSPFFDRENESKIQREDVPFPHIQKSVKTGWVQKANQLTEGRSTIEEQSPKAEPPKFDRKKAWEEAPTYDLKSLKRKLGA